MGHDQLLVGHIFANAAASVPDRLAVVHGDRTLTFGELDHRANRLARALLAHDLESGGRVVTLVDTSIDVPPLFAAAAKAGIVYCPANPGLTHAEAVEMVGTARPGLIVGPADRADVAGELRVRFVSFDELLSAADIEPTGPVDTAGLHERAPHVIFFTSGSTGRSKGVVISHRASVLRSHPGSQLQTRGPGICTFPLFHMAGFTTGLNQWHARAACVYVPADPVAIVGAIRRYDADRINCIPAVWRKVFDHLDAQPEGERLLPELKAADTGTSATPTDLLERIAATAPNATVRVFYGSTEGGNVCSLEHVDIARKPGSCGVVSPLATIKLDGGELCVSGPLLMDGYFDDPAATAEAIAAGWYRTGDLAEVDDDGYVTIVGRANDVIRSGGEWVSPAQVETVLRRHPKIADVAVVGVPDEQWGEVVTAAVVPRDIADPPTLGELAELAGAHLARHKRPRRIALVDAIPRTPATGQVRRRDLVAQINAV